ncbi:MAG: aminopeptidase P family N-terminal domain-containing protein [Chloroflexi bacterium]|nr:aminopeptidase P family N-terminal domain-containing protein [Chloroflexota bacterium]
MKGRVEGLVAQFDEKELDGVLISAPENRRYLSGFSGSAGYLFITKANAILVTDSRYTEQATNQSPYFEVRQVRGGWGWLIDELKDSGVKKVGFESQNMTVASYNSLIDAIKGDSALGGVSMVPAPGLAENQRIIKDQEELVMLQLAIDAAASLLGANKIGKVGRAWPGISVNLAEDGEILVKGPNVFMGYFNDPSATASELVDGWLHTGDLGEFDEDGYLTIIGRKKDILITSGGLNIAPRNIEAALMNLSLVSQAVCIGDQRKYITALLTLNEEAAANFAQLHGIEEQRLHTHPALIAEIQNGIDEQVNANVSRAEHVRKFCILPRDFTLEDGELTPTLKVKRRIVIEHFHEEIESMYSEYKQSFPEIKDISVDELLAMDREDLVIVDVRESNELEVSMIPGALSRSDFEARLEEFGGMTIVVHCTIGYRSGLYVAELNEKGIDAVIIGTPDHTHATIAMAAMELGKHVYCEKPLAHTMYEVRMMTEAAREHNVATQLGNQGKTYESLQEFAECIWAGTIGEVREVHIQQAGYNYSRINVLSRQMDDHPVPDSLDWDLWLGPASFRKYSPMYHPGAWRGWSNFGTGMFGDWVCHLIDPVFTALDLGAPTSVVAEAEGYDHKIHGETFPKQLYIEPEECIDCGVCGPECPWEAIFEGEQVPNVFEEDTALNAKMLECKDEFRVPEVEDKPPPTPEQIAANQQKWSYAG